MKKNGFTLAEVLITLAIIGVVATLTLPALMTNTAEQQAKTALKKGINTLTEAAQMSQAIDGINYGTLTSDLKAGDANYDEERTASLYALLARRTNVDFQKSGEGRLESNQGTAGKVTSNYAVFFRDGSALLFDPAVTSNAQNGGAGNIAPNVLQNDGLSYGICAIYDTNGSKGPNVLSNCQGAPTGVADEFSNDNADLADNADARDTTSACDNKRNRVIKDQFGVRLRDGYAVPNGVAARWAFEN